MDIVLLLATPLMLVAFGVLVFLAGGGIESSIKSWQQGRSQVQAEKTEQARERRLEAEARAREAEAKARMTTGPHTDSPQ